MAGERCLQRGGGDAARDAQEPRAGRRAGGGEADGGAGSVVVAGVPRGGKWAAQIEIPSCEQVANARV